MLPWFHGQEWYVMPMNTESSGHNYPIVIHNKTYTYKHLNHELIWSDLYTHKHRHTNSRSAQLWNAAPRIPVLAFSSKLIYPRSDVSVYARWADSSASSLEQLDDGRQELRIRTPVFSASDEEWEAQQNLQPKGEQCCEDHTCQTSEAERREPSCASYAVLGLLGGAMVGLYAFSLMSLMGY